MTTKPTKDLIADAVAEYLNENVFGTNQTLKEMLGDGSRVVNTTYTNSTGKLKYISLRCGSLSGASIDLLIDGSVFASFESNGGLTDNGQLSAFIPNGSTFRVNDTSGDSTVSQWWELIDV